MERESYNLKRLGRILNQSPRHNYYIDTIMKKKNLIKQV